LYDLVELSRQDYKATHVDHNKSIDHISHRSYFTVVEQDQMIQKTSKLADLIILWLAHQNIQFTGAWGPVAIVL